MQVQVLFPAPSVPTLGTASELIRYDRLAFLYANPGPMPPFSPVFRRITRLGLRHGPGSFVNLSDQLRRESVSRGIIRIYRVPRVRRVIRVIRVIRVRIAKGPGIHHRPRAFARQSLNATSGCLTRHARGIIEKRCIGGFCSPLEYGAGLDQSEIQRGRSFAECDPGRSIPPDRIGSAGANWNGNIKARTTTPGIVPGSLLSFGVIILFANNNIVYHRLPNNPAFTRLFLERIKLFWIELFSAICSRIVHRQISTHLLTVLTK